MRFKSCKIGLWSAMLLAGCAQVKPIPGGDKDRTPPKVIQFMPANEQLQFGAKSFAIEFDEYITLNNVQQELVVSPPLQSPPSVTIRQKTVVVSWKEELLPNTTYNFQFGDGIVDVNEANKAANLQYVFSTGTNIDTASSRVRVIDNLTSEPSKQVKVLLYENDSDIVANRPRPIYISKTNDQGIATFRYLRNGTYALYALEDANGNYRADDNEKIGWLQEPLNVTVDDTLQRMIRLSQANPELKRVEQYMSDSTGVLHFYWPALWGPVQVESLDGRALSHWTDPVNDTIWTFLAPPVANGYSTLRVTNGMEVSDTLTIPYFTQSEDRWALTAMSPKYTMDDQPTYTGPHRIEIVEANQILLDADSIPTPFKWVTDEAAHRVRLEGDFKPGQQYKGWALPGVFKNNVGILNDSLKVDISFIADQDLGSLQLDLTNLRKGIQYELYLINKKDEVAKKMTISQPGQIKVSKIIPGEYQVRLLEDLNLNGRGDLATASTKTPAERWFILSKNVLIRSNWEIQLKPDSTSLPLD